MSTATGWDIPGHAPHTTPPTAPPRPEPEPEQAQPIAPQAPSDPPLVRPKPKGTKNPLAQWYRDMRDDAAARKNRADGRWWFMRWMNEQPTSVADYLHYALHERYQRRDGRKGWGLSTEALLIDGTHAALFRLHALTVGLALTLITYALGWMAQRPGRFYLLAILAAVVIFNLNTWLAK